MPACFTVLIHIEVESAPGRNETPNRLLEYYSMLRLREGLPIIPICLYLKLGLEGIGWDEYVESIWEDRIISFRYAYVGLPALDGREYLNRENLLGTALAALMKLPEEERLESKRKGWNGSPAQRIMTKGNFWRRNVSTIILNSARQGLRNLNGFRPHNFRRSRKCTPAMRASYDVEKKKGRANSHLLFWRGSLAYSPPEFRY
jgi:hypothetical protein